eukprot:811984_1
MTSHEQIFSSSPTSNDSKQMKVTTEMTDVLPTYDPNIQDDNDSYMATPEPEDKIVDDKSKNDLKTNDNDNDNDSDNNNNSDDDNDGNEEEKDDLYNVLAPKQTVSQQVEEVVSSVPDHDSDNNNN